VENEVKVWLRQSGDCCGGRQAHEAQKRAKTTHEPKRFSYSDVESDE